MVKLFATFFLILSTGLYIAFSQDNQTLRYHAHRQEIYIGAAVNNVFFNVSSGHIYTRTLHEEFNMLVAENAMKFGPMRPQPGVFNFASSDHLIVFAQEHQMTPRGHALIWHNQLPQWVNEGEFTRDSLLSVMEEHITKVVGRYKGIIREWDVVNEAIDMGEEDNFRRTLFYNVIGPEYIDSAFVYAHRADPEAFLFYNDYSADQVNGKSNRIYDMVEGMLNNGIPIHGVGLQGHFVLGQINHSSIDQNIKRFGELGVLVNFTEIDIRIPAALFYDDQAWAEQGSQYRNLLQVCLDNDNCTSFVMWGFTDRYSWIPGFTNGNYGQALILDNNYQPKPAYFELLDLLSEGYDFPAAVNDSPFENWNIFPNPAVDYITISGVPERDSITLKLYDMQGRLWSEQKKSFAGRARMSLQGMPAGIYALRIITADGKTLTKLIHKTRL